jgi:hypothetical protein
MIMFKRFKKNEIMLCPKCKQPTLKQATNISGWLDTSLYKCTYPGCGYVGRLYITINPKDFETKSPPDTEEEEDSADDQDNA